MSSISNFFDDLVDVFLGDTPEEAEERARAEAEANRIAEAYEKAEAKIRNELRESAAASFNWEESLPQLRKYTGISAQCLGRDVLESPQILSVPKGIGSALDHLRQLVRVAFWQYDCAMPPTKVRVSDSAELLGSVEQHNGIWHIDIQRENFADPERLLWVVAHEVAHVVLHLRDIAIAGKREDEELTDTVAIMGGFGPIFLRACYTETIRLESNALSGSRSTLEYLHPLAVAYLALVRARMCSEGFPRTDRGYLIDPAERRLNDLCRRHTARVASLRISVSACLACGSRLGLPVPRVGRLRVVCPLCAFPQIVTITG